jgi:hypothetical protein
LCRSPNRSASARFPADLADHAKASETPENNNTTRMVLRKPTLLMFRDATMPSIKAGKQRRQADREIDDRHLDARIDHDGGQLHAAAILRRTGSRPANLNVLSLGGVFPA